MKCLLNLLQLQWIISLAGSLQSSEDTNGLKKTRHEHKSSSVALLDGGRSLSSVENVPSFISDSNMTVIYTYSGATAHIDCGVNMLGSDNVISWVRKRDLHILSIASITYTADRRFSCTPSEDNSVWRLSIQSAHIDDSGQYECQISTEPKISKVFRLNVTDAVSKIQSGPSMYVKEGSALNLTCVFSGHVTSANHIYWYRDNQLLNSATRGGVSIVSNKVSGWSNLVLFKTLSSDSGVYRCQPSNARKDEVLVNIIKDGDLAAGGLTGSGVKTFFEASNIKQIIAMFAIIIFKIG